MSKEETLLVRRAIHGDVEAFSSLYGEIYKDLYRFALYSLKQKEDAEDCVSETVMDAWAQIRSLRKEESFRAWMFRILSNKCKQKLRSYLIKAEEIPETIAAPTEDTAGQIDIWNAFGTLDAEDRMILSLTLFGGYTSAETGQMLGLNDNTVRSRQKRALEKMAVYLR